MKKKLYEKPQMTAVEINSEGMLCLSGEPEPTKLDGASGIFDEGGEIS